jgi:sec-independent protein translocase protein TatA
MGPVGVQEMIVIFIVALVLFGPKKLPELGKTLGKAITEFRRAQSDLKATFEREMQSLERENESIKQATQEVTRDIYHTEYDDPYSDGYRSEMPQTYVPPYSMDPDSTATNPSTVSASAVSGAESHETTAVADAPKAIATEAAPAVPATVARTETSHSGVPWERELDG